MKASARTNPRDPLLPDAASLLHAIFEQAAVGVAQIETATGRYPWINPRPCDLVCSVEEEIEP
jgi:hypothetical protein